MEEFLAQQLHEQLDDLQAQLVALQQENIDLRAQLQACEQAQSKRQANAPHAALESRLLAATAMAVNALQSFDHFDVAVKTVLQALGESLEADRVGVIENFAPSPNSSAVGWRVLYEWTSPHAISQMNHPALSAGTWEGIEHWYERLSQGQGLSYLLEELPEPFRSGQAELGLKALHVVPIFVAGEYWGAAAFDDCQVVRHRSTAELTALKITADCLGTAIQCDRTQQALLAAERERAAIAREQEQAAQARATELAKANRALKQAVDVLATETDLNHFIGQVLRLAAEQFEAPLAEYWQVTNPNLGRIVGWWGHQQMHGFGQDHDHPALQSGVQVPLYMLEHRQFSDRRHHFVASFDHSVAPAEGEFTSDPAAWYASFGVSWQLNLPLLVGETCFGVLNFWQPSDRPFTEQQIELGYALAQQVTLAIRLSQLAEQTKQAAIAREQEKAAQARAAELAKANEALASTAARLAGSPDLSAVLGHITLEAITQLGAGSGHLVIFDEQRAVLHTAALVEADGMILTSPLVPEMPVETVGFHHVLLKTGKPRFFDLETESHLFWAGSIEFLKQNRYRSVWAVPLLAADQCLGHLGLAFTHPDPISEQRSELIQALAHQAVLAIQLTRLAEEAKQAAIAREQEKAAQARATELVKANEVLRRTASQLVEQQSLNHFLDHVLLEVAYETGAVTNVVFLYNEQLNSLTMSCAVCDQHIIEINTDPRFELWRAPVPADHNEGWDLVQSRGYAWHELEDSHVLGDELWDFSEAWHRQMQHHRVLSVFLQVGNQPLGFMGLCFRGAVQLSSERIELVRALADQAALAIQLTRLAEAAKQAAIAREQEQAAQAQAAELSKANILLRHSLSRLSTNPNLDDVLGHLLVELVSYVGAAVGHLFIYDVAQETLNLKVRCRNGQAFETPAADEPELFQAPIPVGQTQIFTQLQSQPQLVTLNQHEFEGHLWQGVPEWFQAKGYRGTSCCILMVGDRPFGLLAMAFAQPIAFQAVEEELILALAQQLALVMQLTLLSEADKQNAVAREQEQAAQARAAELAKANEALARISSRLTNQPDLSTFLSYLMFEAVAQVGADGGHLTLYNKQRDVIVTSVLIEDGKMVQAPFFPPEMPVAEVGFIQLIRETRKLRYFDLEAKFEQDAPLLWRDVGAHHQRQKHVVGIAIPLFVGDEFLGHFGLAFKTKPTLTEQGTELLQALAHQAALAIQLTQLAEEAKQAAILEERNRMAREIHDTIAQGLSGILIQLQAAEAISDAIAQQEHLTQARQLAELSLIEARRSVQALRPQALDAASLIDALTTLTHQLTRQAPVKVIVHMCGVPYALLPEVENHLFRIAQESITNVLRHAQASQIHLTLLYQPLQVQLIVQDDGQGFDPDLISTSSYGVLGMQERAQAIGAMLTLTSQPGQGTTIAVLLPVSPSVEESDKVPENA